MADGYSTCRLNAKSGGLLYKTCLIGGGVPEMLTYSIARYDAQEPAHEMDLEGAVHVDTELESSRLSVWIGLLIATRKGLKRYLRAIQ